MEGIKEDQLGQQLHCCGEDHDDNQTSSEDEDEDEVSCSFCPPQEPNDNTKILPTNKRLGIIFDIDGTLIAEGKRIHNVIVRPGVIPFLSWCKERGHSIALWTKAHSSWAKLVEKKLTKMVALYEEEKLAAEKEDVEQNDSDHEIGEDNTEEEHLHNNSSKLFDFVWTSKELTRQSCPSRKLTDNIYSTTGIECKWCEVYSTKCQQCTCYMNYTCPCREIKDLRKVWYSKEEETRCFVKERTLIVENTPQNCIYNYGNAIYVPTCRGQLIGDEVFERFQAYLERDLEGCGNVRTRKKCNHGSHYHACFEQSWLSDSTLIEH